MWVCLFFFRQLAIEVKLFHSKRKHRQESLLTTIISTSETSSHKLFVWFNSSWPRSYHALVSFTVSEFPHDMGFCLLSIKGEWQSEDEPWNGGLWWRPASLHDIDVIHRLFSLLGLHKKEKEKGGQHEMMAYRVQPVSPPIFDFIDLLSSDRTIDLLTGLRIRIELTLSTTSIVPFPFCFLALTFVSNQTNKVLTGRLLTWLIGMSWWKYIFKRHAVWPSCC